LLPSGEPYRVYHGTNLLASEYIKVHGISLVVQNHFTDFGQGFYVTLDRDQAHRWAVHKSMLSPFHPRIMELFKSGQEYAKLRTPACIMFDLNPEHLTQLNGRIFALPHEPGWDEDKQAWRAFVEKCLAGEPHHYDYVYGPVRGPHPTIMLSDNSKDQLSLHSARAVQCLSNMELVTF